MVMNSSPMEEFSKALELDAAAFGVEITPDALDRLTIYYRLLDTWNARLHLVAPCSPVEFARRHILESLMLVPHLPDAARVADIGSGAGLPIIPCLIVRSDIKATLIESSKKKTVFLREALTLTGRSESANLIAERFERMKAPDVDFISCRALDRLVEKLPRLIEWAPSQSTLLLFGGIELRKEMQSADLSFTQIKIPKSERRFLFVCRANSIPSHA